MKIQCKCGSLIHDGTDGLRNKAHVLPDRAWEAFLEASDAAIEGSGVTEKQKEEACMRVRSAFGSAARLAYQCSNCGRIFLTDRNGRLHCFSPDSDEAPKGIFDV